MNKKVLLRERKRHTARCVANTRYVVLTGYPPGGVPGTPGGVYPVRYPPGGGTRSGTPPGGGLGTPPVDRQTPVKTVPSRRTTYAGGNKVQHVKWCMIQTKLTSEISYPMDSCLAQLVRHWPEDLEVLVSIPMGGNF